MALNTHTRIVLIGSGNLATQVALALHQSGNPPIQIWSQTLEHAKQLASKLPGTTYTNQFEELVRDADLYLIAISDHVLGKVVPSLPQTSGIWAHTAGSIPIEILSPYHKEVGVFYPLQTFSKERRVNFSEIPIYIEGCHENVTKKLEEIGLTISKNVFRCTSEQRLFLHLAAVFACNFTNHLYAISEQLLTEHHLPKQSLAPLIAETSAKAQEISAYDAQTGPAKRDDTNVMQKHIELLQSHPDLQELYQKMSKSILKMYHPEKKNNE